MFNQFYRLFYPPPFFLHVFHKNKNHNMLALMFDPRFKNMQLVIMFLGCENVIVVVVEYDALLQNMGAVHLSMVIAISEFTQNHFTYNDIFCCSDENLLLFLLMETNKLLMFDKVEKAFDLHSQVDSKGLFHTIATTTNTYNKHIREHCVKGACWILMISY